MKNLCGLLTFSVVTGASWAARAFPAGRPVDLGTQVTQVPVALPAAGILGLCLLVAACALGGVCVLWRKRRVAGQPPAAAAETAPSDENANNDEDA